MTRSMRRTKRLLLLAAVAAVPPAAGCTSIRSTLYSYNGCDDQDRVQLKCLKGVPTTLNVPTHLRVTVYRSRVGKVDANTGGVVFSPELQTQSVDIQPVYQAQVFTVDFKRPASGTLNYKLGFDKDRQYITSVDNHVEDTTITDVTGLVEAVIKAVPPGVRAREAGSPTSLTEFQDVIACELFAIGEPNLQERVQEFLATYVNNCAPNCGPCPVPGPGSSCPVVVPASHLKP